MTAIEVRQRPIVLLFPRLVVQELVIVGPKRALKMMVASGGIGEWAGGLDRVITVVVVGHVAVPVVWRPLARHGGNEKLVAGVKDAARAQAARKAVELFI